MLMLDHFSTVAEKRVIAEAREKKVDLEPGWGSKAIRRLTVVRCLKGFQLSSSISPRISFVKDLLKMSQANYPYITDNSFFVNTPWMFTMVWSILKTALSSHTQTKIHILNTNFHGTLSRYISPDNLPPDLRKPGYKASKTASQTPPLPACPVPQPLLPPEVESASTRPELSQSGIEPASAPASFIEESPPPPPPPPNPVVADSGVDHQGGNEAAESRKSRSFALKLASRKPPTVSLLW
jgi:hypothetical protein